METLRLGTAATERQLGVWRHFCNWRILLRVAHQQGSSGRPRRWPATCNLSPGVTSASGLLQAQGPLRRMQVVLSSTLSSSLTQPGVWSRCQLYWTIGEGSEETGSGHSLLKVSGVRQPPMLAAEGTGSRSFSCHTHQYNVTKNIYVCSQRDFTSPKIYLCVFTWNDFTSKMLNRWEEQFQSICARGVAYIPLMLMSFVTLGNRLFTYKGLCHLTALFQSWHFQDQLSYADQMSCLTILYPNLICRPLFIHLLSEFETEPICLLVASSWFWIVHQTDSELV